MTAAIKKNTTIEPSFAGRKLGEAIFKFFAILTIAAILLVLLVLIVNIVVAGSGRLNWTFLTSFPSRFAAKAGIYSALAGSISLMILTALISLPIGVGAAIYLEEYAKRTRFTKMLELNIANLAAIPSIIYGILGLELFVRVAGLGRSLIAGALTMALLVLPIIVIAAREALRRVPDSIRHGALALGATRWQTVRDQVLPAALPGIMTGCILALSRAIGETAPLITLGALTYVAFVPDGLLSAFTVLPIQTFNWISRPQLDFHQNAAAAIVVLLIILGVMNATAIWLRMKFQKRFKF